jgi:hypothetical protein
MWLFSSLHEISEFHFTLSPITGFRLGLTVLLSHWMDHKKNGFIANEPNSSL